MKTRSLEHSCYFAHTTVDNKKESQYFTKRETPVCHPKKTRNVDGLRAYYCNRCSNNQSYKHSKQRAKESRGRVFCRFEYNDST